MNKVFWQTAVWLIKEKVLAELIKLNIFEDWASDVKNNFVSFRNPIIITDSGNIDKPPENIMDNEAACKMWLKGDCWNYRKGLCDLAQSNGFCKMEKAAQMKPALKVRGMLLYVQSARGGLIGSNVNFQWEDGNLEIYELKKSMMDLLIRN